MDLLAGPFALAAVLLVVGGSAKAVRPRDTAHALTALGLPGREGLVRALAGAELIIGLGALVVAGPLFAGLVALSYGLFVVFVVAALRSGHPISSCGCFGKVDTPPSVIHVTVNFVAAVVALAAVFADDLSMPHILAHQPLAGAPFVLLVGVGALLVVLSLGALPKSMAATRAVASAAGR